MKRFGAAMEREIKIALTARSKVSVFDDDGHLLWFCENWEAAVGRLESWSEALGHGWLEFVHHDDLAAVHQWIKCPTKATIRMRTHSGTPDGHWVGIAMSKRRVGRYWLAIGDRRKLDGPGNELGPWGIVSAAMLAVGIAVAHKSSNAFTAPATRKPRYARP